MNVDIPYRTKKSLGAKPPRAGGSHRLAKKVPRTQMVPEPKKGLFVSTKQNLTPPKL